MPSVKPPALDLEKDLNPQQLEAVKHGEGPQLVLAGAGSGKTRLITYRIAWLVHERGVDPASIVAVTFTNKAAGEMHERVEDLVGIFPLPVFVGTFHRFALTLLRRYGNLVDVRPGFAIFDRDDQIALVKKALASENLSESTFPPRGMLSSISAAKNKLMDPAEFEAQAQGFFDQRVARVYGAYQGLLTQASALDFDDMLRLAVKLLVKNTELRDRIRGWLRYLLVDEFQDTNHAQLRMILELIGPDGNLTAVGDEDQGIYRWRGAELSNILEFEDTFPGAEIRKLERNYRSTEPILAAAGSLIAHNQQRRGKSLWTDTEGGEPLELHKARDEQDEASWTVNTLKEMHAEHPWSEMAILLRTNAQTRALEEELIRQRVPYDLIAGVRFYERAEIKDVVAYLRLLRNPRDSHSLQRILNRPPRGIGKGTQALLAEVAEEEGSTLWDVLEQERFGGFSKRAAAALQKFRDLIVGLRTAAETLPLPALVEQLLEDSGYANLYRKDNAESQARLENLEELLSAAQEFAEEHLSRGEDDVMVPFLDHVALVADIDGWHPERGVSVMTLHSAKGLEFDVVALTGLEEGLLPHFNAGGALENVEEERRLLYVGMTRARQRLFLSCCRRRRIAGRYQDQMESQFLSEIPEDSMEITESPRLFSGPKLRGVYSFFDRDEPVDIASDLHTPGGTAERGRRVRHGTLGEGVVLAVAGEGDNLKITVFFDRAGKRVLLARYANLEVL